MNVHGYRTALLSETLGLNISSLSSINITAPGESVSLYVHS